MWWMMSLMTSHSMGQRGQDIDGKLTRSSGALRLKTGRPPSKSMRSCLVRRVWLRFIDTEWRHESLLQWLLWHAPVQPVGSYTFLIKFATVGLPPLDQTSMFIEEGIMLQLDCFNYLVHKRPWLIYNDVAWEETPRINVLTTSLSKEENPSQYMTVKSRMLCQTWCQISLNSKLNLKKIKCTFQQVRLYRRLYMHVLSRCSENSLHCFLPANSSFSSSTVLESLLSDLCNWWVFHQFLIAESAMVGVFSAWLETSTMFSELTSGVKCIVAWPLCQPKLRVQQTWMMWSLTYIDMKPIPLRYFVTDDQI